MNTKNHYSDRAVAETFHSIINLPPLTTVDVMADGERILYKARTDSNGWIELDSNIWDKHKDKRLNVYVREKPWSSLAELRNGAHDKLVSMGYDEDEWVVRIEGDRVVIEPL